jgi:hypothetical protein
MLESGRKRKNPWPIQGQARQFIIRLSRNTQSQSRDSHATSWNSATFLRRRGGTSVSDRAATWHYADQGNGFGVVSTSSSRQTLHSPTILKTLPKRTAFSTRLPVLLQCVSRPAAFPDLRQVVVAGQFSQMRFDRIAVRRRGFLDFLDRDFSSRLCEFHYLT